MNPPSSLLVLTPGDDVAVARGDIAEGEPVSADGIRLVCADHAREVVDHSAAKVRHKRKTNAADGLGEGIPEARRKQGADAGAGA